MKSGIRDPTPSREKWGTYDQKGTSFELEPFFSDQWANVARKFLGGLRDCFLWAYFASRKLFFHFGQLFLVPW